RRLQIRRADVGERGVHRRLDVTAVELRVDVGVEIVELPEARARDVGEDVTVRSLPIDDEIDVEIDGSALDLLLHPEDARDAKERDRLRLRANHDLVLRSAHRRVNRLAE